MAYDVPLITPQTAGGSEHTYPSAIAAPGPFVTNGDYLILNATTSNATGSIEIRYRLLLTNGEVVPGQAAMTFSGTGTQTAITIQVATGWIIGFDVHRVSGTLTDGQVVASVHVGRNTGTPQQSDICLASGEVTDIRSLGMGAFLYSTPAASAVAAPSIVTTAVSNPSAGADFTITVTAGQTWEIQSLRASFLASATVATRFPRFTIDDGTNILLRAQTTISITANGNFTYNAFNGATTFVPGDAANYTIPFPRIMLPAGHRLISNTTNIQAGDQWSAIVISYRLYT